MSSLNLNKVVLAGHLTADPELKNTPNNIAVARFGIAVNRRYNPNSQETDYINVVAWRQTAEFISKYFHKGSAICITGSLQTRTWTDQQNGQKRYATEVVVDEAMFVDSRNENASSSEATDAPPAYSQPAADVQFEELRSDDDLPF